MSLNYKDTTVRILTTFVVLIMGSCFLLRGQEPVSIEACEREAQLITSEVEVQSLTPGGLDSMISILRARGKEAAGAGGACCAYPYFYEVGKLWNKLSNHDRQLEASLEALKMGKDCDDNYIRFRAYINVAKNFAADKHLYENSYDSAIYYGRIAIELGKEDMSESLEPGAIHFNLGEYSLLIGEYEEAKRYLELADQDLQTAGVTPPFYSAVYLYLGRLEETYENYPEMVRYMDQGLESEDISPGTEFALLGNLGDGYTYLEQYEKSLFYLEKAWARSGGADAGNRMSLAWMMANAHSKLGNTKVALNWCDTVEALDPSYEMQMELYPLMILLQASLSQFDEVEQTIAKAKVALDSLKVEEIRKIKESDLLVRDSLKNTMAELSVIQNQKEKLEMAKTQSRLVSGLSIMGLLLISGILFFLYYRRNQRLKEIELELELEKQEQKTVSLMHRMEEEAMDALREGEDSARRKIAEDLHDGLGGTLAAVNVSLTMLKEMVNESGKELFTKSQAMLGGGISEVRRISHDLSGQVLERGGLYRAVSDLTDLLKASATFELDVDISGTEGVKFATEVERNVYRIIQELLQNVVKHAKATRVVLQLSIVNDHLSLIVEDNGAGLPSGAGQSDGIGMKNLHARVQHLDGTLDIDSQPNDGTTVLISIPLNQEEA